MTSANMMITPNFGYGGFGKLGDALELPTADLGLGLFEAQLSALRAPKIATL
jgi:hypothetical protein